MFRNALAASLPILTAFALTACSAPDESEETNGETSPDSPPPISDFSLEQRDDGLFYEENADTPFSGTHITPDLKKEAQDRSGFIIETPYTDGKIHGDVITYYPGGAIQEERTFSHGIPERSVIYYSDGAVKSEVGLNSENQNHGPFFRFYRDGTPEVEAAFKNNRWHGEKKVYDEDGELKSHYIWEEHQIVEVLYESEEGRASRLEHFGPIHGFDEPEPETDSNQP